MAHSQRLPRHPTKSLPASVSTSNEAGLAAVPGIRISTSRKVHTPSISAIRMPGIGSGNVHYYRSA